MLTEKTIYLHDHLPSHKINTILCPVDLSPNSAEALRYGVVLAALFKAKLLVCHSIDNSRPSLLEQNKDPLEIKTRLITTLEKYLPEEQDLNWEAIVIEGKPAEAIINLAETKQIDMIILCSRRRPLGAALLGSTAETICHNVTCPVIVTHPQEKEANFAPKRLLVAYDRSSDAEIALSYAVLLAQHYKIELHMLNAIAPNIENAWCLPDEELWHKTLRRLQYAVPEEAHLTCEVKYEVCKGQPYKEILRYAETHQIDLICMGAKGLNPANPLLGSNVDKVLRNATCPVLVAHLPTTAQDDNKID